MQQCLRRQRRLVDIGFRSEIEAAEQMLSVRFSTHLVVWTVEPVFGGLAHFQKWFLGAFHASVVNRMCVQEEC